MYADLSVISHAACTRIRAFRSIPTTMVCASDNNGSRQRDSCQVGNTDGVGCVLCYCYTVGYFSFYLFHIERPVYGKINYSIQQLKYTVIYTTLLIYTEHRYRKIY
jgi:hypothetical protein